MKTRILICSIVIVSLLTIAFQSMTFTSGGFGDSTGAPLRKGVFSAYTSCANVGCHTGNKINSSFGGVDIVSDIPSTGWEAGKSYRIKVKVAHPDRSLWGFQMMAWGSLDSMSIGNFTISKTLGDSAKVNSSIKTVNGIAYNVQYATHKSNSLITGNTGIGEWTFNWQAPAVRSQNVYFYATGNAANGNGGVSGDYIYLVRKNADSSGAAYSKDFSTIPVSKLPVVTDIFAPEREKISFFQVYPTLATSELTIQFKESRTGWAKAKITAIASIQTLNLDWFIENDEKLIDISSLVAGPYLLTIQNNGASQTLKFVKQ